MLLCFAHFDLLLLHSGSQKHRYVGACIWTKVILEGRNYTLQQPVLFVVLDLVDYTCHGQHMQSLI